MSVKRLVWCLLGCAAALAGAGQARTVNERLVELAGILGSESTASAQVRIRAIEEIAGMGTISGLASGLVFDHASFQLEESPEVREASALAVKNVCDLRNRAFALRLRRVADPTREPDPRVRIAALRSLAAFQCADAASGVLEATSEAREPDPTVREAARELVRKGLASSAY